MSNHKKHTPQEEVVLPAEENISAETTEETTPTPSPTDILTAEIAELKTINEKLNKDLLLSYADFDNFRKRTLREKADLLKNGGEESLKRLLPIIDDFERGLEAIHASGDVEALKEGVELIYSKFQNYLTQNGVKPIETHDADFNTEYHEAVTTFPAPTPAQKGKIIDCVQKGYTLNDKVMRFAKVVVGE